MTDNDRKDTPLDVRLAADALRELKAGNVEDAADMLRLAQELQEAAEKNAPHEDDD